MASYVTIQSLEEISSLKYERNCDKKVMTRFTVFFQEFGLQLDGIMVHVKTDEVGVMSLEIMKEESSLKLLYGNMSTDQLSTFKSKLEKALSTYNLVNMTQVPTRLLQPFYSLIFKEITKDSITEESGIKKLDFDVRPLLLKANRAHDKDKKWYSNEIPKGGIDKHAFSRYWTKDERKQLQSLSRMAIEQGFPNMETFITSKVVV